MLRSRTLAVVVVALTVAGAVVTIKGERSVERSAAVAALPTTTTTTIQFGETTVVVASGVANIPLAPQELEATEEALARATTTTTTIPAETTTTIGEAASSTTDAPPATTATTHPPATTTTTAPAPTTTQAPAGGYGASQESSFASNINGLRSSNGLAALSRASSLDSYARSWAKKMAENGSISHSNFGSLLGPWSAVGENVGAGGSVSAIFNALSASSGHRANMLGDFTHMGIGVWIDGAGTLWTAHVFAR